MQLPQSPQGWAGGRGGCPKKGRGRRGTGLNVLEHERVYSAPVSSENHKALTELYKGIEPLEVCDLDPFQTPP